MIQNIWRIVLCFSPLLVLSPTAQDKSTEVQVEEVLVSVQSYSGQMTDRLVELGKPAVPAMCQKLDTVKFPMTIVNALARIKDPRATLPLLEFLSTREPFSPEEDTVNIFIVDALKEIGDVRAEKKLADIMTSEPTNMRFRLCAAGALARFGSPSVKEQARIFIMSAYAERSKYIRSSLDHDFLYQDIYVALCEVGTDKALDIVLNVLGADSMPYQKRAILKYLPKREDEKIVATLLEVSANEDDEVPIRLKALDILMTFESKVSTAALRNRLDDLEQNDPIHEIPEFKRQFNALIKQLSRREQEHEKPFFPSMTALSQDELKPLLEEWDKAVESDKLQEKGKAIMKLANYVPENMRFRGSRVLRYSNPEIKDRIVALYLKECAKANQLPPDVASETNPWHGGDGEYMIFLMTMAESTFDPRIYETKLVLLGVSGDLRILYLATVNPERTLNLLLESKRGQRIGKRGHQDFFYHGDIAWGMSVDDAYSLLSLMSIQSPKVLRDNRDRVLAFVATHLKHYASPRKVKYKSTPVYLKWQDYDVRNGALDVLGLLGTSEDIKTVEDIIRDAPQIDPKRLNGGPRDRREQIQQKGIRVIEQIRQRTANMR
jgi:HEAT repeat protein